MKKMILILALIFVGFGLTGMGKRAPGIVVDPCQDAQWECLSLSVSQCGAVTPQQTPEMVACRVKVKTECLQAKGCYK